MEKYTKDKINEMRDKMNYLIEYDISKTKDDNALITEAWELYKIADNTPDDIKKNMKAIEGKVFAIVGSSQMGGGDKVVDQVKVWDVDGNNAKETDEYIKGKFKMGNLEKAYDIEMKKGEVVGVKKLDEGVSPKSVVEKLSAAVSLKEWALVEEVLSDLLEDAKPRVFSPEEEETIRYYQDRNR